MSYDATRAILTLDDLALLVYGDKERAKAAADELVEARRPHMTLERRDRGDYTVRKLWHPCETRFFDPRRSLVCPTKPAPAASSG